MSQSVINIRDCGACIAITGRDSSEKEALQYHEGDLLIIFSEGADQPLESAAPTETDCRVQWVASNGKLSGSIIWSNHKVPTTGLIGCVNMLAEEVWKCWRHKYQKMKTAVDKAFTILIPLQKLIVLYDKTLTGETSLRFNHLERVVKRLTSSLASASRSGVLTRGMALKKCLKDIKVIHPIFASFVVQIASVPQITNLADKKPNDDDNNNNNDTNTPTLFNATPVLSPTETYLSSPGIQPAVGDSNVIEDDNQKRPFLEQTGTGNCGNHLNSEQPQQTEEEVMELGVRYGCWECSRNAARKSDDPLLRAQLWRVAAARGCPESMLELGKLCEHPDEGAPLLREAVCWYQESSTRGYPEAKYRLALLKLSVETETTTLLREVESLLAASASSGVKDAAIHLGWLYESQKIKTRNPLRSALRWYKLAAIEGSIPAYSHSGYILLLRGKLRDAFKSLSIAANNKDPEGMFSLSMMYLYGIGVSKDFHSSKVLMREAAALGHPEAKTQFGNYLYSTGDKVAAFELYEQASLLGSYEGCCNIISMLTQNGSYRLNTASAITIKNCKERCTKLQAIYSRWSKPVISLLTS
eukprot:TRINITY_DN2846_c0_g1_i1.p1 TRINITY_DN2846_c0_g1~~TRINITY_DN2846_c0_g1_i1.p1  ORF type:complete len:585 (+),score=116.97 TRINITY_DN2846_c0_g1_i1:58-1812(+)